MQKTIKKLLLIILTCYSITTTASPNHQYLIIIDAGSSGSRIHIYQYEPNNILPNIEEVFTESTKPGIATYADHPTQAATSLNPLLNDATAYFQKSGIDTQTIPINLLATAGMRLIPKPTQDAIYKAITTDLQTNYNYKITNIKTITGKMEGIYGWLTINYLQQTFQQHQDPIGSIDMGGASTEITYTTNDTQNTFDNLTLTINNTAYQIYSKSFIGLGTDQIDKTLTSQPNANTCFPEQYPLTNDTTGEFNFTHCESIYRSLLLNHHIKQHLPNHKNQHFIAFGGIYYNYAFFNTDQSPTQPSLESKLQTTCNTPWPQLKTQYPNEPENYLATYCANGVYFDQLLYKAYAITDSELTVTNKIKNQPLDWTLGAALYSIIQNQTTAKYH